MNINFTNLHEVPRAFKLVAITATPHGGFEADLCMIWRERNYPFETFVTVVGDFTKFSFKISLMVAIHLFNNINNQPKRNTYFLFPIKSFEEQTISQSAVFRIEVNACDVDNAEYLGEKLRFKAHFNSCGDPGVSLIAKTLPCILHCRTNRISYYIQ